MVQTEIGGQKMALLAAEINVRLHRYGEHRLAEALRTEFRGRKKLGGQKLAIASDQAENGAWSLLGPYLSDPTRRVVTIYGSTESRHNTHDAGASVSRLCCGRRGSPGGLSLTTKCNYNDIIV